MKDRSFHSNPFSGCHISHTPAPILKRLIAYAIDLGIFYFTFLMGYLLLVFFVVFLMMININLGRMLGYFPMIMLSIIVPAFIIGILVFYHAYFFMQEYRRGRTPGKHLMGLYVICTDSSRPGLWQCILRDFMRYVDALLILPGLISMNVSRQNRRLGDYMAGTMVCHASFRDDEQYMLFLRWEDFQYLKTIIDFTPFPQSVARKILAYATNCYLYRGVPPTENELQKYELLYKEHLHPDQKYFIDKETLFLFAAEEARGTIRRGIA